MYSCLNRCVTSRTLVNRLNAFHPGEDLIVSRLRLRSYISGPGVNMKHDNASVVSC